MRWGRVLGISPAGMKVIGQPRLFNQGDVINLVIIVFLNIFFKKYIKIIFLF